MAGKNCVAIATDTRLSTQLMTVDSVSWDPVDAKAFDLPAEIAALKQAPAAPAAPAKAIPAQPAAPAAPAAPATK